MNKKQGTQRRLRRGAASALVVGLALLCARPGVLPNPGYTVLYEVVAAPGRVAGHGERSALLYFRATCLPYRYPRNVIALQTLGERKPGVERTVFTCRME